MGRWGTWKTTVPRRNYKIIYLKLFTPFNRRHGTQHNDIEHNDTQHNDIELNDTKNNDIEHNGTQH